MKTLKETSDGYIRVDSTEAEDLEPLSYSEPPLPVQKETAHSPVSEEISFPWTEEPAEPHDNSQGSFLAREFLFSSRPNQMIPLLLLVTE